MMKSVYAAGLGLAVAFGSLGLSAPVASAQGFEIQIGPDGVRAREGRPAQPVRPVRECCSERQALAAARQEGLRNAAITRVTDRSITVEGDTRRGVDTLRFANQPGCPLI